MDKGNDIESQSFMSCIYPILIHSTYIVGASIFAPY